MTEYELIDAIGTYSSGMQSWTALFFSGVSAYLITAYVAGKSLNKSQAIIISAGFILFAINSVLGFHGLGLKLIVLNEELSALRPENTSLASELGVSIYSLVFVLGILVSLKFMWDIRHPKE
jgi:hypothetical protein